MRTNGLALICAITCATTGHTEETGIIEEMVVIAHPLSSEGLAQPTIVLEGDALARNLATTLGETLINQPGIHSSSFGQAVGRPVIRGLGGARVRIMEDRIDAMDASVSSPDHATTIDPFMADRIEVLKGPSTLLYGNGAIGGVVDVHSGRIPHQVPDRVIARAELRAADNADRRTAAGMVETGIGGMTVHVDGFYRDADEYEIPAYARSEALRAIDPSDTEARGVLPGSELQTNGGAFGASLIGSRGFFGGAVSVYNARYGLPGADGEESNPVLDVEQLRFDVEGALREPFSGAESLNFRLGLNDYDHLEIEPSGQVGTTFDNTSVEARLEVVHVPLAQLAGAVGIQVGHRNYRASGEEAYVPPVKTDFLGAFWVAERAFPVFDLEAGLRYEHVSHRSETGLERRFDLFAGSIAMIAPFNNGWTLSVQLDHSSRAPVAEELYSNGPHLATRSYERGDPELDEERASNVSATAQYDGDRFRIGASVYYMDFRDFIFQRPSGVVIDDLPVFEWRQADATFHGLDLEAHITALRWEGGELGIRGFYDRVRGRLEEDQQNLPRIPPARYGLGLELNWSVFTGTLEYARTDSQEDTAPFELPTNGFDDLRAYLGVTLPLNGNSLELFLTGRNLTNDEQRHHTSFIKDLAPQPGRTIEGGLRITL